MTGDPAARGPTTPGPSTLATGGWGPIVLGVLSIDGDRREAHAAGERLRLRAKEFDLLVYLATFVGTVVSREQLLRRVWGYDELGHTRTVDAHVYQLRRRLHGTGVHIETRRGVGYTLLVGEPGGR